MTQEPVNIAQKAHIYAFSAAGPRGNRGVARRSLNSIENLMLVCGGCHTNIDKKWAQKRYTVSMLLKWKRAHEQRIARVTEIGPDKRSHILRTAFGDPVIRLLWEQDRMIAWGDSIRLPAIATYRPVAPTSLVSFRPRDAGWRTLHLEQDSSGRNIRVEFSPR